MDTYTFKRVSNTDVAIIGYAGGDSHGVDEYM